MFRPIAAIIRFPSESMVVVLYRIGMATSRWDMLRDMMGHVKGHEGGSLMCCDTMGHVKGHEVVICDVMGHDGTC